MFVKLLIILVLLFADFLTSVSGDYWTHETVDTSFTILNVTMLSQNALAGNLENLFTYVSGIQT